MEEMNKTSIETEAKRIFSKIGEGLETELFNNFLAYWIMRKSNKIDALSSINDLKTTNPSQWLKLIESNHKFRNRYGEETAEKIIKIIELQDKHH